MTKTPRSPSTNPQHRPWPLYRKCSGIALDLGSSRTRAWIAGRRGVLDMPTVTFAGDGDIHPIQRGAIVDTPGTARMIGRLLGHRLPRFGSRVIVLTAPALGGSAFRTEARTAVEVLRPHTVLTVPTPRAVAVAADADLTRPLLVVDLGAHLTEVTLLVDGAVTDARQAVLGTSDLDSLTPSTRITDVVVAMVAAMLEEDPTTEAFDALRAGTLLAGGGALRPDMTYRLADQLRAPIRPVPAPHTAAIRGAAKLLESASTHPSALGTPEPAAHPQ
ncbi:rod shape-determining protein [Streptomyces sp. AS58]|uniref:rod shape-determining protein n=1 Tax=Streptomyces sp. AS58 TaxID=1519489 RepID=UPI0006AF842E|nr:rod shape-determining protein [Streptomyces sp. AS58]